MSSFSVKDVLSSATKGLGGGLPGSDKKSLDVPTKSSFGMDGFGASLFGGKKDVDKTPTKPAGSASAFATSSQPDYRKLLVDFYTTHNPSKLGDVDKHLEKYKVRKMKLFVRTAGNS